MLATPVFKLQLTGYDLPTRTLRYVDVTGDYSPTNAGGYGGPNNARDFYALLLVGERRETTRRLPLPPATGDVLAGRRFRLTPGLDGWAQATLCAVPLGDASVAPPAGDPLPSPETIVPPITGLSPLTAPVPVASNPKVATGLFCYDPDQRRLVQRYAQLVEAELGGDVDGAALTTAFTWEQALPAELLGTPYAVAALDALVTSDAELLYARLNERVLLLGEDQVPDQFREPQGDQVRKSFAQVMGRLASANFNWQADARYEAQGDIEAIYNLQASRLLLD